RILRNREPDPGQLHFNHALHLQLDLKTLRARGGAGLDTFGKKLECTTCHQPDDERRYMKPVKYEIHCKQCHALTVQVIGEFKERGIRKAADAFRRIPAPHKTPAEVRAVLRERFLEFIQENPAAARAPAMPEPKRLIPGRGPKPVTEPEAAWAKT